MYDCGASTPTATERCSPPGDCAQRLAPDGIARQSGPPPPVAMPSRSSLSASGMVPLPPFQTWEWDDGAGASTPGVPLLPVASQGDVRLGQWSVGMADANDAFWYEAVVDRLADVLRTVHVVAVHEIHPYHQKNVIKAIISRYCSDLSFCGAPCGVAILWCPPRGSARLRGDGGDGRRGSG